MSLTGLRSWGIVVMFGQSEKYKFIFLWLMFANFLFTVEMDDEDGRCLLDVIW